jgi:HSP20 family protein
MNPLLRTLNEMQSEVNRVFDRWGHHPFGIGEFPAINLWEEEDAVRLQAELPGLEMKDLELFVSGRNQLTLKGERTPPTIDNGVQHRRERSFGKFSRTLTLPFAVDENRVEAKLENGILTVTLPKHEAAKPRKISIKS